MEWNKTKMNSKTGFYWFNLLIFFALILYWVCRIWMLILTELADGEENYLGSLMLYLFSWLLIFLATNLFAWLNFKYLFLKWREFYLNGFVFWAIELGILALFFELLQWLSQYELEVMKDNFILTLVIGFYFLAFTWFFDMIYSKRRQVKLMQEKDRAELNLLQSQLNPHFLFNAMNTSYHSAIEENSPKTAQQILQISDLMRFALEKSSKDYISIEDEIGFLEKYIQLQKDRFYHFDEDDIQIDINWDGMEVPISPMLLQPFLENAFKFTQFGITDEPSKFAILLDVEEGKLLLNVENSYFEKHVIENKGTGRGLELVKQRLKSLYPNKHHLMISEKEKVFEVVLKIDLKK